VTTRLPPTGIGGTVHTRVEPAHESDAAVARRSGIGLEALIPETRQNLFVERDLQVFAVQASLAKAFDEVREGRHQEVEAS